MNTRCIGVLPGSRGIKLSKNFLRTKLLVGLAVASLLGSLAMTRAEEPDAKYMRSYYAIEKGDTLAKKGQTDEAKAKYLEAQAALKDIKAISPNWNSKAVSYRMSYVTERIESLSQPAATNAALTVDGAKSVTGSGGALPQGMQVKLLSAGGEPRTVLRFAPKAGESQKTLITLQMAMGAGGGELMKIPAIKISFDAQTKGVSAGDINNEIKIEDIGIEEGGDGNPVADAMKASFGSAKGMVILSTVSDRGAVKKTEVKFPPGADPATRQSMEQMKDSLLNAQVILPEEAVGPDAKWEVTQKLKAQGMTIDQKVTSHLIAIDGNVLTIESTIDQSAANQKITNPAMPQLKMDLTKLTGSSKGQATVDLTKVLPTGASITGGAEMQMTTGSGGSAASMAMKTEMSLKIESK